MFSIVVAIGKNGEIGKDNRLLWSIPEDLKNFRKITGKKKIVMGRRTFESIGRLLPDRHNIILSGTLKKENLENAGTGTAKAEIFRTFDEFLDRYGKSGEEIFIIGGEQIYRTSLDKGIVEKLYISHVDFEDREADAYFPEIRYEDYEKEKEELYDGWKFCVYRIRAKKSGK